MPNMSPAQVKMPEQPASERINNFDEVALGYDEEMAVSEAARCLNCKTRPCIKGCPVNIDIPGFISLIGRREFDEAFELLRDSNTLPAICGRVCPQETQCEQLCVRAIKGESVAIGKLERFAADRKIKQAELTGIIEGAACAPKNGRRVAVVGSGPASLTCAGTLAKYGYEVKIFESFHMAGGVLVYGIPEFRLPKKLVKQEIDMLLACGVEIEFDTVVGKTLDIYDLFEDGYEAVFLGTGAGLPSFLKIPGENLCGVYSANEFLTRINMMRGYQFPRTDTPIIKGKNVAVFGGGNVALDAARCAKRLGADNVYIVYRRSEKEMPARVEEVHHARDEGIVFQMLTNPKRFIGDDNGWVRGVECFRMELGEPDASGRRRPIPVENSDFVIDVDVVVVAIGQSPNPIIKNATPELKSESWGGIVADEVTGATSMKGVYAGGDVVTGAATVILAMGAGKTAAAAIDEYIKGKNQ
ncbi:MAG: NADPH-dependent glutamate synthase [Oscillospiraceae bacterium]|nr:NADPH-dependent glutamate synthase [Oscillospiraceae bacterium]